jgi:tRNA-2-methylthio-N6-dimethylallyladenosine synthase
MPNDVSEAEKTERIVALQRLQRDIQTDIHEQAVGRVVSVLVDSTSRRRDREISGRTGGNTVVNFPIPDGSPADWLGRVVDVTVRRAGPNSVWGEAAPESGAQLLRTLPNPDRLSGQARPQC